MQISVYFYNMFELISNYTFMDDRIGKNANQDVDIEFPISVPSEDEDIMCDESASLSDSTSSYKEIATINFA